MLSRLRRKCNERKEEKEKDTNIQAINDRIVQRHWLSKAKTSDGQSKREYPTFVSSMQANSSKHLHHIINSFPVDRRKRASLANRFLLRRRDIPRLGFDLLQTSLAPSAPRLGRVDALRVTSVVLGTINAGPYVLVVDLVVVFGGHFDSAGVDGMVLQCLFASESPLLETGSVGVVVDLGDHVVGQMAVFMG